LHPPIGSGPLIFSKIVKSVVAYSTVCTVGPRVEKNRKEDDTGEYWCVARNSLGSAVSKRAKLEIACKFLIKRTVA
jgi:hypothetical protein